MKKVIPALTSLRFFAAAAIVIQHGTAYFLIGKNLSQHYILIQGVTFFFVLSGFILTYCYPKLEKINDASNFIWARISRIWPLHLVTLIFFSILWGIHGYKPSLGQFFANITLTQAWHPQASYYFSFNGVTWTLSVEMFFYCMFPFLILGLKNNWFIKLFLTSVIVVATLWSLDILKIPVEGGLNAITIASWAYIWPPIRLFEFVLGMIAALAWLKYEKFFTSRALITLLEIFALVIACWASTHTAVWGSYLIKKGLFPKLSASWFSVSAPAPFFAFLLFALASGKGYISKLMSLSFLVLLGEISFSLYMTHQIFERLLEMRGHHYLGGPEWAQYAGYWCFILVLSYLLWRYVEKPFQKALRNKNPLNWLFIRKKQQGTVLYQ